METILTKLTVFLAESPGISGALAAFVIATFRVVYDGNEKKWQRVWLEGVILGCLALASKYVFLAFKLNPDLAIVFGTCVGFVGLQKTRELFVEFFKRKAGNVDPVE